MPVHTEKEVYMARKASVKSTAGASELTQFGQGRPLTMQEQELRRRLREEGEEVGRRSVEAARDRIRKQIRLALGATKQGK